MLHVFNAINLAKLLRLVLLAMITLTLFFLIKVSIYGSETQLTVRNNLCSATLMHCSLSLIVKALSLKLSSFFLSRQ